MKRILLVGMVGLGVGFGGCLSVPELCDNGACDASAGDGPQPDGASADAATDRDPPPPGCTTPEEPLKNPEKCLVDAFGAFVSPTGDDGNDGSKAKPFKTVGKALGTAKTRIVVCEGTYAETLEIGRDVEIYGSVACSFDKAGNATTLESGKPTGLAVTRGTVGLYGIGVTAKDGVDLGESSIGILVSTGVTFRMVGGAVVAGAGVGGAEGTTASNYAAVAQSDPKIKGNDAMGNAPGATQTCAALCTETPAVAVTGGRGGLGDSTSPGDGADGTTAVAGQPAGRGMRGIYNTGLGQCVAGNAGGAADGANGGAGAPSPGTIDAGKWTPSRGSTGSVARPGQGGGGGSGGISAATGGGGSGGCGGCGGGKGVGGMSGGSSFAVLSVSANVSLENVSLKAGAGGKGGKGGDGEMGQLGGNGGSPAQISVGCPGGLGGQGGQGGGGGGGAGGHSVAVAYTGTKPALKSITPEVAQAPAAGGDPGASAPTVTQATAGAPGKTGADLAL